MNIVDRLKVVEKKRFDLWLQQIYSCMYRFGFEKLEVWQKARKLTVEIYRLTEKFPEREKFGLTNQLRRASVSIGANIAEGATRSSAKEQAHFSSISYGSLMETMSHLITSVDLNFITEEDLLLLRNMIQSLSLKINNLRNTQLANAEKS
ncbi:MAG TPA: four helix bundle protein [Ferruginibacter sp.]|nr:four helix bundle protein [Ferruginibacter sp.]